MELCTQLNYVRSLSPGKAYFYYLEGENKRPIQVDKTRIRAPKSGYAEGFLDNEFTPKELAPQDLSYSNPQYIEECYSPPGVETVYCKFSLRINANSLEPEVCSQDDTRKTLKALAHQYKTLGGYSELAKRFAKNILMGTWLWRNRGCRSLLIQVTTSDSQDLVSDNASRLTWQGQWDLETLNSLECLSVFLEKALTDPTDIYYLDVIATLGIGEGEELYPSQEFLDKKDDTVPSKQLAKSKLNGCDETIAFHAQKIGAALQTIDDWWHPDADKPLRVNEYGADRKYVIARRHPQNGNDFFQLVRRAEEYIEFMETNNTIPDDVHYIMSVLVKANLFNNRSKG